MAEQKKEDAVNIVRIYPYRIDNTVITKNGRYKVDRNSPTIKNVGTQSVKIDGAWFLKPGESYTISDVLGEYCVHEFQITFNDPDNTGNQILILGKVYVNGYLQ